ncbi:putative neuroblastoma-amplified sequence [Apostichopus japonicus]|uniref:Putative neuroblastoma-amplified sequence n=1 Tax=Stichopus japonicus TaxID=307972 RepID=A0A2G8LGP7_STIJA|nr:putative neuroblastoma-amplified sequence [Apostichopus japonicus]
MQEGVYPLIDGSDHASLLYYYTLLQGSEIEGSIHSPEVHVKLLKKIKNGVPRLDYKEMMEGHPYKTLPPVLIAANVHIMAKMANKLPNKDDGFLTSSQVFGIYVKKLFWHGDQGNKKKPESIADWLHRYEACGEFFSKLSPNEFSIFVKEILFSEESLKMLELECRQNIIGRALKYTRQKGGSKQKFVSEVSEDEMTAICGRFQHYQKHLQSLVNESVLELKKIDEQHGSQYYSDFDLTCGDEDS